MNYSSYLIFDANASGRQQRWTGAMKRHDTPNILREIINHPLARHARDGRAHCGRSGGWCLAPPMIALGGSTDVVCHRHISHHTHPLFARGPAHIEYYLCRNGRLLSRRDLCTGSLRSVSLFYPFWHFLVVSLRPEWGQCLR